MSILLDQRDYQNLKVTEKKKRNCYEKYISLEEIEKEIKKGKKIKKGIMNIKRGTGQSYVKIQNEEDQQAEEEEEIVIKTMLDRNRSLDGDLVYIDVEEKKIINIVKSELLEKINSIEISGHFENKKKNEKYRIFVPTDLRWPKFIVKADVNEEITKEDIYTIKMKQWLKDSYYPIGRIKRYLGNDIHAEVQSLLIENQIRQDDFPSKMTKYLKKYFNKQKWNIPKSEIENRKDFRNLNTFTIDDENSKDLDDAISIRKLEENEEYEIGVHISDVSFFVPLNSSLDLEAKERCSSIYLPTNEIIPMLPLELSENLCSLLPNQERLTISIIFNIKENGFIDPSKIKFYKSIIKSKKKFSYKNVEDVLNKEENSMMNPFENDLNLFLKISNVLRTQRFQNGSLEVLKENLKINEEELKIEDDSKYSKSKQIIEEMMILTNHLISKKLNSNFSIFRNHSEPKKKKLDLLQKQLNNIGLNNINFSSTFSNLHKSLYFYKENENIFKLLNYNIMLTFENANYSLENKSHFGLNLNSYCHFTSPIRRYPDLFLHRIFINELFKESTSSTSLIDQDLFIDYIDHFNKQILKNQKLQDSIFKIYLNSIISKNSIKEQGIISSVDEKSIKILVSKFDLEQKISFNPSVDIDEFMKEKRLLILKDKRKFKLFDSVNVEISCRNNQIKLSLY
eukprot:gene910-9819_t